MRKLITGILLFIAHQSFSQCEFLKYIKPQDTDSIHVYPSKYFYNGKIRNQTGVYDPIADPIPPSLVSHYGLDTLYQKSVIGYCFSFYFDKQKSSLGIGIGVTDNKTKEFSVKLFHLDTQTDSIKDRIEIASHHEIPGTMKETRNAIIMDSDDDGDLDVNIMIDLTDYEELTPFADNISGVDGYTYAFRNDSLVYEYISRQVWFAMKISH